MDPATDLRCHDANVYSYEVVAEARLIVLHTEYWPGDERTEFSDIEFHGVAAHQFEHVLSGNILFDIVAVEARGFVERWASVLGGGIRYGVPEGSKKIHDVLDLVPWIDSQGLRAYEVASSYGLQGFVLAERAVSVPRMQRWVRALATP